MSSKKKSTATNEATTSNNKLRVTIYARYSSDGQREESIEGQLRECKEYAERQNMVVMFEYLSCQTPSAVKTLPPNAANRGSVCVVGYYALTTG